MQVLVNALPDGGGGLGGTGSALWGEVHQAAFVADFSPIREASPEEMTSILRIGH